MTPIASNSSPDGAASVAIWRSYDGLLADVHEVNPVTSGPMRTRLFGWDGGDTGQELKRRVPTGGASYGFVICGPVEVFAVGAAEPYGRLQSGQWFALPDGVDLQLGPQARLLVVQSVGFRGLAALGGPIESIGRLRYIDRCSDTLLMSPPLLGDPCLNHLHFPSGVEQTEHTHPSGRFGAIASGVGYCDTRAGRITLDEGAIFHIPAGTHHRFVTEGHFMNVIAFHPDSDWGPTDENHPMINRTWVYGSKMDNNDLARHGAQVAARTPSSE